MRKLQALILAFICASSCTFSACDMLGGVLGSTPEESTSETQSSSYDSSLEEDSSSSGDSVVEEDSSSSVEELPPQEPQLLATPIDVTGILTNEDGSTKLAKGNLGGSITLRGVNYPSFSSGWEHVEGNTDTVRVTNATYVFESGFVGEEYYLEGVFDSTTPSFMAGRREKQSTGWAGLLIAHGATKTLESAGSYKITTTIHESNILLQITNTWYNGSYATILANWTQLFTAEELETLDFTNVKLGVLRYGVNEFAFYVNDRYVVSRTINNVPMSTSTKTEMIKECGIGLMGEQMNGTDTDEIIRDFKYTADTTILDAMSALVPKKSVDIYLIAGQSNASGNSTFKEADMRKKSETTYYGNNNVYYLGAPGADTMTLARVAMGDNTEKIGPEVGIAEALQAATYGEGAEEKNIYDATLGTYAAIVKRGVGGSSLLDDCSSDFDRSIGNWCPPSYAKELGKGYDTATTSLDPTGRLYRELVSWTVKAVREFEAMGFTKIRLRGMFWMQGERNRGNSLVTYKKVFQYLVKDLRADLKAQVGDIVEQDFKDFSIFVGEISSSFYSALDSTVAMNRDFIALQNEMVVACRLNPQIGNVYIVDSSEFALNKIVDGVDTPCGADLGGTFDHQHWNQHDMYEIGKLAGMQMGKITAKRLKEGK